MMSDFVSSVATARRIVVKVGSSLVTNNGQGLDPKAIGEWSSQIAALCRQNKQVILVSSGAIAEGMARLKWKTRPKVMSELQAAAAVGQMGLVQAYESAFAAHNIRAAQILLTHEDLTDRLRYLNARSALFKLLELGVIPIVNENDTVVTDEIRLGDNDTLGAVVSNLIEADALVILTDQRGLYDSDPRHNPDARFIHLATAGDPQLQKMAGGAGSHVGTGGMLTKVLAAQRAASSGASTVIASGREERVLERLGRGEAIGTELRASATLRSARKQWMADHLRLPGKLVLDDGALKALTEQGKSLLAVGVADVIGEFERGDVVACTDSQHREVARGLVNYSSADTRRIMRHPTREIESILGNCRDEELIHRNNMVVHNRL
ncbi:gamma-glutamyl kinase [Advenella kashmirensis W13003]|uniref:Glutamate 5-kinase n=2 Tax=Advenella kashmirensis TaxID=310575 RepID=V8QNW0_9BURK|nr:gamma-glutamyl kinase [Advenella kashmirensis W13003]